MAVLKIQDFAGVAPRWSARLLPQNGAVAAENCKLLSGEARGLHETSLLYDFSASNPPYPIVRAFRLPSSVEAPIPISDADTWLGFIDTDVDFVRTPVLEDQFERYYWTSDSTSYSGVPVYNTRARIDAGSPPFILGIPTPVAAPTVVPAAGDTITRAYIYTFVSAYGEEGSPSSPTTETGEEGTWEVSGWDTTIPTPERYNITTVRIYRTVAGATTTEYYFVADLPFAAGTITGITKASAAVVTINATDNPFSVSDPVVFSGVVGMTQINGQTGTISSIGGAPGAWTLTVNINSSGFTAYSSGGLVGRNTPTYNDTALDTTVVLNFSLQSLGWTPPPTSLKGIVAHPGGFLVGFDDQRNLWMSVPYQPHAWPQNQIQTTQTEIAGIAIFNNCIIITTTSHPYIGNGMSPSTVTLQKLDSIDPCVNRRSIATTLFGVYYASPQGIILNDSTESYLTTEQLFTRQEWQQQFSPTTVMAAPYGLQYLAFDTSASGFIYSPAEQLAPLSTIDRFSNVSAIQQDPYSGDVYLVQNDQVRLWDPPNTIPYSYTWTSKEFDLPKPVNFGAFRLKFAANPIHISPAELAEYTGFNAGRILSPLNCVGSTVLGGVLTKVVSGYPQPQIKDPLGGSPIYDIAALTSQNAGVQVRVYARDLNSVWNLQYSQLITDEKIHRLTGGFKSDCWQISLISNVNVYSIALAEVARELQQV